MLDSKMCRTCLKEKDQDENFRNIFDACNESGELIGSLLIDCVKIEISMYEQEKKPSIICNTCYTELMRWYAFRELAKKSDEYLSGFVLTASKVLVNPLEWEEKQTTININNILLTGKTLKTPILQIKKLDADWSSTQNVEDDDAPVVKIEKVTTKHSQNKRFKTQENKRNHTTSSKRNVNSRPAEIRIGPLVKRNRVETKSVNNEDDPNTSEEKPEMIVVSDDELSLNNKVQLIGYTPDNDDEFVWSETVVATTPRRARRREPQPENFFCCMCYDSFEERINLMNHIQVQHSDNIAEINTNNLDSEFQYHCEFCSMGHTSQRALKRHQRQYRRAKPCDICGVTVRADNMSSHKRKHTNEQKRLSLEPPAVEEPTHCCCLCVKTFNDTDELQKHVQFDHSGEMIRVLLRIKNSKGAFQCGVCQLRTVTFEKLQQHQRRFQKGGQCVQCGEFVPSFRAAQHRQMHLGMPKANEHQCDICKKFYQSLGAVRYHMESHVKLLRLVCPREGCDVESSTRRGMESHIRTHAYRDQGKVLQCPMCPRAFYANRKGSLKSHIRIHTGENPFQCQYCEKSFIDRTDWTRHEWVHNGNSPYRCSKCDQMFTRKKTLVSHEAICKS